MKKYYTVRYTYLNDDDTLLRGHTEVAAHDEDEAREATARLWLLNPTNHDHRITSVEAQ